MNCCNEYGDCRQGRDCPARKPKRLRDMTPEEMDAAHDLPITMADDFLSFDYIMRWLWAGMAWLGFFGMLALIAFFFGYKS